MTPLRTNLVNFKLGAEHAPEGTYIEAKKLNELLTSATKNFFAELELSGLNVGTDELKHHAEAALYDQMRGKPRPSQLAAQQLGGKAP